ncbi:MAG: hypothetical protein KDA86_25935 [Planctomycetaceae bacterium]|nr:hypothetical protein [Planctomycetaceae bacterium]
MSQSDENDRAKGGIPWVTVVLVMPIGYVLSIGPIIILYGAELIPEPVEGFLAFVYKPLEWLYEGNDSVRLFLDWYMGLFAR